MLHRRWPSRSELAAAAIGRHVRLNPIVVPDLGNVRDELLVLLRKFSDRSPPQLVRLIFEMSEDLIKARSNFIAMRNNVGDFLPVQAVLDRAVTRGEIDASKLTPRLALLPTSLARHEIMMTLEPLSDAAIREIVDQIFLPLVAVERPSGRQKNA